MVPAEDSAPEPEPEYWENEPETLDALLDQYVVEGKCNAGVPGGMIYVTNSMKRNEDKLVNCTGDQRYKLFFVTDLLGNSLFFPLSPT